MPNNSLLINKKSSLSADTIKKTSYLKAANTVLMGLNPADSALASFGSAQNPLILPGIETIQNEQPIVENYLVTNNGDTLITDQGFTLILS